MAEEDIPALDPDTARTLLEARRRELWALAEHSAESRAPVELDQTRVGRLSRMDALQNQAMALETERRRQSELQRIEAALARIAAGDYGFCIQCEEPIGAKRLSLDPSVPTCIRCAQKRGR